MTKKLFVSDLHLGSPLSDCDKELIDLFNSPEFSEIFIVGDLIDSWEDDPDDIVFKHMDLIDTIINSSRIIIVMGNHDPDLEWMMKTFPNNIIVEEITLNDIKILHGHQFDHLIGKHEWFYKILFPIHWVLERLGINMKGFLASVIHSVAAKKQKKYYDDLVLDIEKMAVNEFSNYKYIIMGHTHLGKIASGETTYINCGSITHEKTYVEYDGETFFLKGIKNNVVYDQG